MDTFKTSLWLNLYLKLLLIFLRWSQIIKFFFIDFDYFLLIFTKVYFYGTVINYFINYDGLLRGFNRLMLENSVNTVNNLFTQEINTENIINNSLLQEESIKEGRSIEKYRV